MKQKTKLKRELGLFELTLYGVGIILGAGIYALIGIGAGIAGNALWISFVIAAIIASFTGLSYAELSSLYPREAAEYVYTKNAFHKKGLSFLIGWIMVIAGIIAAATVSLGFAGYFSYLFGGPPILIAILLILFLSFINYYGIKESARFNILSTIIEASGLLLIIVIGLFFITSVGTSADFFELPSTGLFGVIAATALIFFAYIGFEDVANIAEEVKNPRKIVPKALILALIISTILYILVAISSVSILGWQELSQSKAPLTEVVATVIPSASVIMSLIALFATSNTVLIILIVVSRILYGISREHSLPRILSRVHSRRKTPYVSIFLVMSIALMPFVISSLGSLFIEIKIIEILEYLGKLTTIGVFIAYLFVNLSLIAMRYSRPEIKRPFKTPINIGKFPVLAFLGAMTCLGMLFYFDPFLLLLEFFIILGGAAFYKICNK